MNEIEWIHCSVCGNKTRNKIRTDTVLKKYPLYCPKCKQETLIVRAVIHLHIRSKFYPYIAIRCPFHTGTQSIRLTKQCPLR
ncbi:MAG: cysteine-rich KTR domain-containing protein [Lachnospiraceae bacterium]